MNNIPFVEAVEVFEEPEYVYPPNWNRGMPTAQDDTDAMMVDHEYRLTLLELGLTE